MNSNSDCPEADAPQQAGASCFPCARGPDDCLDCESSLNSESAGGGEEEDRGNEEGGQRDPAEEPREEEEDEPAEQSEEEEGVQKEPAKKPREREEKAPEQEPEEAEQEAEGEGSAGNGGERTERGNAEFAASLCAAPTADIQTQIEELSRKRSVYFVDKSDDGVPTSIRTPSGAVPSFSSSGFADVLKNVMLTEEEQRAFLGVKDHYDSIFLHLAVCIQKVYALETMLCNAALSRQYDLTRASFSSSSASSGALRAYLPEDLTLTILATTHSEDGLPFVPFKDPAGGEGCVTRVTKEKFPHLWTAPKQNTPRSEYKAVVEQLKNMYIGVVLHFKNQSFRHYDGDMGGRVNADVLYQIVSKHVDWPPGVTTRPRVHLELNFADAAPYSDEAKPIGVGPNRHFKRPLMEDMASGSGVVPRTQLLTPPEYGGHSYTKNVNTGYMEFGPISIRKGCTSSLVRNKRNADFKWVARMTHPDPVCNRIVGCIRGASVDFKVVAREKCNNVGLAREHIYVANPMNGLNPVKTKAPKKRPVPEGGEATRPSKKRAP